MEVKSLEEYYNDDYLLLADVMTPPDRTAWEITYVTRLLEIGPGAKILDLGCGYGRIAHELARNGAIVTAIDLVPAQIERAKRRADADRLAIDYRVGDMSRLSNLSGFDFAIMWFFSFGYGDDRKNAATLRAASSALKKGGFLLLDQYNTHVLAAENYPTLVDRGDTLVIHKPKPDLEAGRWGVERLVVRNGIIDRSGFSCRCYTPPELRAMLSTAGFREIRFVSEEANSFAPDSRKLVAIAMK